MMVGMEAQDPGKVRQFSLKTIFIVVTVAAFVAWMISLADDIYVLGQIPRDDVAAIRKIVSETNHTPKLQLMRLEQLPANRVLALAYGGRNGEQQLVLEKSDQGWIVISDEMTK